MRGFDSLEFRIMLEEIKKLKDGFIENIYYREDLEEFRIRIRKNENHDLIIDLKSKSFHLTEFIRDEEIPSEKILQLRKIVKKKKIKDIYQHSWERILILELENIKMIFELFSNGNLIIMDENNKILWF